MKTLTGVREAVEERKWQEAGEQVEIAAEVIARLAGEIDRATAILSGAGSR